MRFASGMRFSGIWLHAITASASLSHIASLRCSDNDVLPTPSYDLKGALFTVCTEDVINAPISKIYDALLDFRRYSTWNTFVVEVDLPSDVQGPEDVYPGLSMNFTTAGIIPGANTSSTEVIALLAPDVRGCNGDARRAVNAWGNDDGLGGAFLPAEHPNLLTDLGNGSARMVSYETYYLPGATTLLPLRETLQERFETQGRDLKRFVEEGLR
ncbi:hypothetical protein BDP55DRAFT_728661 [Colletotrichum godetiae]|uniref:Polyketide cyclase/dehydrase n=1 Tax=Colletotrichum godetiae TaxID=1209918 RepID=A0AAJ0ANU1_9PEZI|nr:uncharacterized protein BDP55DRAFT_728661 [Colletotrichum godetiae]KAK1675853.1 hypothetical protein BDP55DRAFT_728661 [Colletotrichum godetiae]